MKKLVGLMALAIAVSAVAFTSRPASADFTVCSQYRQTIYVAYGYYDGADYLSEGWWSVDPGQCTIVYQGPLPQRFMYLYGENDDASTVWTGSQPFCIEPNNGFTIYGNYGCYTNFIEIDTGNSSDWTHTLTP